MSKKAVNTTKNMMAKPPVVAIVGHIDHGKSTLLDYIRRSNVVAGEAGGITQHLSAYEATHKGEDGHERTITFLDTPGHEAFRAMRSRGLEAADVAILIVSAEEGAKPQTLEALKLIGEAGIPYIVAFTKIDKPGANIDRAKNSMLEHGVYLEGLGGDVPWVPVSSKTGEGIPALLDLILLAADLEGLEADSSIAGEGLTIEAHTDPRRGHTATLIVQNGSVRSGEFVVAEESVAPTRIMENFLGKTVREALPSQPVRVVGFSSLPRVGARFGTVENKKEAEEIARQWRLEHAGNASPSAASNNEETEAERVILPLVIKTDVAGTGEAVLHELDKLPMSEQYEVRVVSRGVGPVSEGDIALAEGGKTPGIVVGFNVKADRDVQLEAERRGVAVETFDVIYRLTEWLAAQIEERRPRRRVEEVSGSAKLLKLFSEQKGTVVLGGRVEEGELRQDDEVRIMRRDTELGRGTIVSLQSGKAPVKKVELGNEFGAQIKTGVQPAAGDRLEVVRIVLQ